jgi:hypothetical protein
MFIYHFTLFGLALKQAIKGLLVGYFKCLIGFCQPIVYSVAGILPANRGRDALDTTWRTVFDILDRAIATIIKNGKLKESAYNYDKEHNSMSKM